MVVACLLGVIVLAPAGANAFAVFVHPSIAKRVPPTRACPRCAARLRVGMDDSASRHQQLANPIRDAEEKLQTNSWAYVARPSGRLTRHLLTQSRAVSE